MCNFCFSHAAHAQGTTASLRARLESAEREARRARERAAAAEEEAEAGAAARATKAAEQARKEAAEAAEAERREAEEEGRRHAREAARARESLRVEREGAARLALELEVRAGSPYGWGLVLSMKEAVVRPLLVGGLFFCFFRHPCFVGFGPFVGCCYGFVGCAPASMCLCFPSYLLSVFCVSGVCPFAPGSYGYETLCSCDDDGVNRGWLSWRPFWCKYYISTPPRFPSF